MKDQYKNYTDFAFKPSISTETCRLQTFQRSMFVVRSEFDRPSAGMEMLLSGRQKVLTGPEPLSAA